MDYDKSQRPLDDIALLAEQSFARKTLVYLRPGCMNAKEFFYAEKKTILYTHVTTPKNRRRNA